jgi:hypothetical protein
LCGEVVVTVITLLVLANEAPVLIVALLGAKCIKFAELAITLYREPFVRFARVLDPIILVGGFNRFDPRRPFDPIDSN